MKASRRAFTLVETLVYLGLLGGLLAIISGVFLAGLEQQLSVGGTAAVEQDGRFIVARLLHDGARASAIVEPAEMGAQSTTLQLAVGTAVYSYRINGEDLVLDDGAGAGELNSFDTVVKNWAATRVGDKTVRVGFSVRAREVEASGKSQEHYYQTTVGLR